MYFWSFDPQFFGLAIDAFAGRALAINRVIEGTGAIQGDTHLAAEFVVDLFDTSTAFEKLRVVAGLARFVGNQQGAPIV